MRSPAAPRGLQGLELGEEPVVLGVCEDGPVEDVVGVVGVADPIAQLPRPLPRRRRGGHAPTRIRSRPAAGNGNDGDGRAAEGAP